MGISCRVGTGLAGSGLCPRIEALISNDFFGRIGGATLAKPGVEQPAVFLEYLRSCQ
jgi:hypothetical protein